MSDSPGGSKRILLATDAWRPQVNGVVRTWETSIAILRDRGHHVSVIEPGIFRNYPAPRYPEIRLALTSRRRITQLINEAKPDFIHIATEGPIGFAVRAFCLRNRLNFTTSYHSKFPEFLEHLIYIPSNWTYRVMRWFHRPASKIFVSTPSMEKELSFKGFANFARWSRGVDLTLFYPRKKTNELTRPILLYAGRVSREKNIESFLQIQHPGTKVVVGDGPIREKLQKDYPDVIFLGYKKGQALAEAYANADVFVFPSKTDTFGLVMIEAMACGIPVAAYPVVGPIDIVTRPGVGALSEDLGDAVQKALTMGDASACVNYAREYTWDKCTDQLFENFVPIRQS